MREVELSLNGTLREIFSFGESRGAFDRFLPSMCVMAEAQRYRPFGHKVDDFDIALDGTTAVHIYMDADHTKATAPFPMRRMQAVHRSTAKSHRFSKFLASKTSILH